MGRIRTIGEKGPAETPLSYRAAREVARGLRARGWAASARFCQGGTTAMVALQNGRRAIGTELNPAYLRLQDDRTQVTMGLGL